MAVTVNSEPSHVLAFPLATWSVIFNFFGGQQDGASSCRARLLLLGVRVLALIFVDCFSAPHQYELDVAWLGQVYYPAPSLSISSAAL